MSLKLDDFTLMVLREGRREGKKAPSMWLPFEAWLRVVTRLLPDRQLEKMTDETLPFWEGLWNRNLSPVEALLAAAVSHPPSERPVPVAASPQPALVPGEKFTVIGSDLRDGDHPV